MDGPPLYLCDDLLHRGPQICEHCRPVTRIEAAQALAARRNQALRDAWAEYLEGLDRFGLR